MMDRLTKRTSGEAGWNGEDHCEDAYSLCEAYGFACGVCPLGRVLDRLCEYEDTGLEPKAVKLLVNDYILNSRNRHG